MKFLTTVGAIIFTIFCLKVRVNAQPYDFNTISINDSQYLKFENDNNLIDLNAVNALLSVDGKLYTDKFPVIESSCSLVPARTIFDSDKLDWDEETNTLTINMDNKKISLTVGDRYAYVNGEEYVLDIEPVIIDSQLYIPTRFVANIFGYSIDYKTDAINLDGFDTKNHMPVIFLTSKNPKEVNFTFEEKNGLTTYLTKLKSFSDMQANKNELFIYNNFPERILSNVFFETYINKTENVQGRTRIFASHGNDSKTNIDYIIRFENKSDEAVSIEYIEDTLVTDKYPALEINKHSVIFYDKILKNAYKQIFIEPYETYDFIIYNIPEANFFAAQIDLKISDYVDITSFIIPSGYDNNFAETPKIPYTFEYEPDTYKPNADGMPEKSKYYTTYSGYSNGFSINAENSFSLSETDFRRRKAAIGFETGGLQTNLNHRNGIAELLDIFLFSTVGINNEIDRATFINNIPYVGDSGRSDINRTRNYCNLGNWGIEYNINTTIENDTNEDKTLSLNLVAYHGAIMIVEAEGKIHAVNHNNADLEYAFKREDCKTYDVMDNDKNAETWEILTVFIPAGEARTISYKYILGTDSMSSVFHIWQEN